MSTEALRFKFFGILVGIGLGLFSFSMMRATKGATKDGCFFPLQEEHSSSGHPCRVSLHLWISI